jgi:hypothetical protein
MYTRSGWYLGHPVIKPLLASEAGSVTQRLWFQYFLRETRCCSYELSQWGTNSIRTIFWNRCYHPFRGREGKIAKRKLPLILWFTWTIERVNTLG